jgi:hypothetical protein
LPHPNLADGVDDAQNGSLALGPLFEQSRSRFAKLPVSLGPFTKFFNAILRNRPQSRFAFDVGSENNRCMPLALGASARGLGALAPQSVDRPFDHRMIRQEDSQVITGNLAKLN